MKKLLLTICTLILSASVAMAQSPSAATRAACILDYLKFCNGTPLSGIRGCFTKNILQLTNTCVSSLIADGLTTKEEIDSLRNIAKANTGTVPPTVRKTVTERISSAASSTIRKISEAYQKATKRTATKKVSTKTKSRPSVARQRGPRPFTDERANNSFCENMNNGWPGCMTRH